MIRYRYVNRLSPPAPFINVVVRCPDTDFRTNELPALLDFGADRSVLPRPVVNALELAEDGSESFLGFAGEIVKLPLFLVEFCIHDLTPVQVRAVVGEREDYILLGRDVLNTLRVLLDGPQLALEIG
jgi:hypothetical protein